MKKLKFFTRKHLLSSSLSKWLMISSALFASISCKAVVQQTFDNQYNHYAGNHLSQLKVCGERCSGTNFLMHLLHANFPSLKQAKLLEYGHKHFLWWFGSEDFYKLKHLKYARNAVNMAQSAHCLFVVVVRDPYDWLRSFFGCAHAVHGSLCSKGFSHFLKGEWKLTDYTHHPLEGDYREIDDFNPWTNKPFSNVLELRKYKIQNYLALGEIVENYIIVRYEDVRDDPEGFINFIAENYHLKRKATFTPITTAKGSHIPYVPKKYFPLLEDDFAFINANIDWMMEGKMGYLIKHEVD